MLIKLAVIKVEECQKIKLVWINFYFFFDVCWTELHLYMFDLKISSLGNIDLLLLFKNCLLFLDFKEINTLFFWLRVLQIWILIYTPQELAHDIFQLKTLQGFLLFGAWSLQSSTSLIKQLFSSWLRLSVFTTLQSLFQAESHYGHSMFSTLDT